MIRKTSFPTRSTLSRSERANVLASAFGPSLIDFRIMRTINLGHLPKNSMTSLWTVYIFILSESNPFMRIVYWVWCALMNESEMCIWFLCEMYRDMKIQRFSAAFLLSAYVSPECDEMDQVHSSTESSMLKNSIECLSLLSDSRPFCLDENDDKRLGISLIQTLSVLFMKKNRHPCTDSNHCFSLSLIDFGKGWTDNNPTLKPMCWVNRAF